ncbi:MAG TPA: D-arabinono-1,4-lactone oxidase [Polyangiales bacterium]|nr:D-arabinono-1,4-lactone oxidase [Polyangiales bacterium]
MSQTWTNWSGSVQVQPSERVRPANEEQLATCVVRAKKLRVIGAGHSFTPLCETTGSLIDLSGLPERVDIEPSGQSAWISAGMSIAKLTRVLWERGYSLANQGDVNPQSLAGALATGTHGTGAELGSLSTLARGFKLMLADGSIVVCSQDEQPELFQAARLSLGLIGIALSIEIALLPAYRLQEHTFKVALPELPARFAELAQTHRHVEFFAFPYADHALVKTLHPTTDPRPSTHPPAWEEGIFKLACDMGTRWPGATRSAQRTMTRLASSGSRIGPAHEIFPTDRNLRFEELEYEVPRAAGFAALQEATALIRARSLNVTFPFEFRWVAGDDIWLSPFNRGPCASISVHQYAKLPFTELFDTLEPIFAAHGGRPHWGKRHSLGAREVLALYPKAQDFMRVHAQVDPTGKLANHYLLGLFDHTSTRTKAAHA